LKGSLNRINRRIDSWPNWNHTSFGVPLVFENKLTPNHKRVFEKNRSGHGQRLISVSVAAMVHATTA
jgi:hypothetical protein